MTKVAVLTIVHGRHDHLAAMLDGCARSLCAPDLVVVVAMDDPAVETQVRHAPLPTRVRRIERAPGGLRQRLQADLETVYADVRAAVVDWRSMLERLLGAATSAHPDATVKKNTDVWNDITNVKASAIWATNGA